MPVHLRFDVGRSLCGAKRQQKGLRARLLPRHWSSRDVAVLRGVCFVCRARAVEEMKQAEARLNPEYQDRESLE